MNAYWKSYLVLLLLLGYGQLLRKLITDTGGPASRYSAAIVATLIVCALIAKSRNMALGSNLIWKAVFSILTLSCALAMLFALYLGISGVYLSAGLLMLAGLVLIPALQQLYLYSFKSPDIWN